MQRRSTKHKEAILECFRNSHALSAKDLTTRLPNIDPSTIYRNLERFCEDGALRSVHVEEGVSYYELAEQPAHGHFVCQRCTRVAMLPLPKTRLPRGVVANQVELTVYGRCAACA